MELPRVDVPFVDLLPSHAAIKDLIIADVSRIIDEGRFVNGPEVALFEADFARYCGTAACVGMANGLDAVRLALLALGIEPGDQVIVPASTFVATFEAVSQAGGRPVPVDVTEDDLNNGVAAAEAAITKRTRFLLPVHLYGQMADMGRLKELAERHDLKIVEDACQAHGAERDGVRAGAGGDAGAFSFYPAKNLGAMGDAGALVTDDLEAARRARALREHGQCAKYQHAYQGYTARLDTIQAAVLLRKLRFLNQWNESRRVAAELYAEALAGIGDLRLPPVPAGSHPVWHVYPVRTKRPEELAEFLHGRGIGTSRHYPCPPHLSEAYAHLGLARGAFPLSEALSDQVLSLPMFPGISSEQIVAVAVAIRAFFEKRV
ncbi:MAG: DegT/DnrJ/EryC1/StrS family aminotransferase [Actinomycetota bacterium]|nr:DegT/DnrJ/EryC1/StrS family aminotransferase [Actinomycetota bacterium]